jgi:hypothetical protein
MHSSGISPVLKWQPLAVAVHCLTAVVENRQPCDADSVSSKQLQILPRPLTATHNGLVQRQYTRSSEATDG